MYSLRGHNKKQLTAASLMITLLPLVYRIFLPFGSPPTTMGIPRVVFGRVAYTDPTQREQSITPVVKKKQLLWQSDLPASSAHIQVIVFAWKLINPKVARLGRGLLTFCWVNNNIYLIIMTNNSMMALYYRLCYGLAMIHMYVLLLPNAAYQLPIAD